MDDLCVNDESYWKLAELLGQDKSTSYPNWSPKQQGPVHAPVEHKIQPWIDLINLINYGKFKINKPKVSRMRFGSFAHHPIRNHYITLSATLYNNSKKINLHHPDDDLNFKYDYTSHSPPQRRIPNITTFIKCGHINEQSVRTTVFDYIHECCQPNLTSILNEYEEAWQNTIKNADKIIEAHFSKISDVTREVLRANLAKFLKNSNFIDMDKELIMTLLGQTYKSLEEFSNFVHKNRQDAEMATIEDIETAQELAKVMQVQEV